MPKPPSEPGDGSLGFKQNSQVYKEAFPDHSVEITNVVATEDQVVVEPPAVGVNYTGQDATTGGHKRSPKNLPV